VPALQTCVAEHAVPQPPQLNGSFASFTQTPSQSVVPCGHWHWPLTHEAVAGHFVPHAPQLFVSVAAVMQALLQTVVPCGQVATQTPRLHSSPAAVLHARPQAPQFAGSCVTSMHVSLHATSPPEQPHRPPRHSSRPRQPVPHAPQFASSDFVSTQLPPHFVSPGPQVVSQTPELQTSPAPVLHVRPHVEQFAGSVAVFVQVPLHRTSPVRQAVTPASPPSRPPSVVLPSGFVVVPSGRAASVGVVAPSRPSPGVELPSLDPSPPPPSPGGASTSASSSLPQPGSTTTVARQPIIASRPSRRTRSRFIVFAFPPARPRLEHAQRTGPLQQRERRRSRIVHCGAHPRLAKRGRHLSIETRRTATRYTASTRQYSAENSGRATISGVSERITSGFCSRRT
jgi:hypothetical protein